MAAAINPPLLTPMPPAPLPTDSEAVFDAKAGASLVAQDNLVDEQNDALTWQAEAMADTKTARDAAAGSAESASDSAHDAAQSAVDASEGGAAQVDLAHAEALAAAQSAQIATAMAQAAGAAAGVPPPVAGKGLMTGADGIVKWDADILPKPAGQARKAVTANAAGTGFELTVLGQQVGDVLIAARAPDATYILANGATRLQADYPELYAALGANKVTPPITQAGTLPYVGSATSISPDAKYLAQCPQSSNELRIYPRSGDGWLSHTTITLPATVPGERSSGGVYFCPKPVFNQDSTLLVVPLNESPFVAFYKREGTVWSRLTNPAALPGAAVSGISISDNGVYIALSVQNATGLAIYKRSGDLITKLSDPATMPAGGGYGASISISPDGQYLALGLIGGTSWLCIYKRAGDVFTKLADPSAMPVSNVGCVLFSPDGLRLHVHSISSIGASGFVGGVYSRSGDVFSFTGYNIESNNAAYSPDGKYLACASRSTPTVSVYDASSLVPALITQYTVSNSTSIVAGVSFGRSSSVYMGLYLVGCANNSATPPPLIRDGYPINPNTEFKVPGLTITNSLPAVDTATKFQQPQFTPYIKAKVAA